MLGLSWAILGLSWVIFGLSWALLGLVLGPLWDILTILESGAILGLFLGSRFGAVLAPKYSPKLGHMFGQVSTKFSLYLFEKTSGPFWGNLRRDVFASTAWATDFRRLSDCILERFSALFGLSWEARNPKHLNKTISYSRCLCMYAFNYLSYIGLLLEASLAHFLLSWCPKWGPKCD